MYKNGYYTTLLAKALSKYYENASFMANWASFGLFFQKMERFIKKIRVMNE